MENKEHTLTENELKKLPPFTQSLLSHALHEKETTLIRRAITAALFMK